MASEELDQSLSSFNEMMILLTGITKELHIKYNPDRNVASVCDQIVEKLEFANNDGKLSTKNNRYENNM